MIKGSSLLKRTGDGAGHAGRRRWRTPALLSTVLAALVLLGGPVPERLGGTAEAAAPPTTWTVCSVGCDFTGIGDAVASVSVVDGDTIDVGPGTYNEMLTITKEVTLLGEQANVEPDAASRVGNESVLSHIYPIAVVANNVTINGFDFTAFEHAIIAIGEYSNMTVKYNRMVRAGSDFGITFGWGGHLTTPPVFSNVTITHNLIDGPMMAISFEGGDGNGANGVDAKFAWIDISYNHFGGLSNLSIGSGATADDYSIDHFTLKGNYFDDAELNCLIGNILYGEMSGNLVKGSPCAVGMQASTISGNSFVSDGTAGWLAFIGRAPLGDPTDPQYVRPTGNVVVSNNDFTDEGNGIGLMLLPDNPSADNILLTTNAFRDSGIGIDSPSTLGCFLEDNTGWLIINYANCGSDGTPDVRSLYLHADNNWWGHQDGPSANSGSLFGKVTTDSWMSYYIDNPAKQVAPTAWPLSGVMTVNPGFWPMNARYRALYLETSDPRTVDLDDLALHAPELTVSGIGTGGAVFQFSRTEQPEGPTPFKVAPDQVFLKVEVLSGTVVYPAQLCMYGEPGFELYQYVGGTWVKVTATQIDYFICSTDLTSLGIFTAAERKTGPAIQYTGEFYVPEASTEFAITALLTGDEDCTADKTVKFINDLDGDGVWDPGEPVWATATTDETGMAQSTHTAEEGIYELLVIFEGDELCDPASNTATVVVAGTGYKSTGGGWYTENGRINFGYTVSVQPGRPAPIVKGQMLWTAKGKSRLKGVVTAYTQSRCTVETVIQTCGYITGYGDLYEWNSDTEMWDLVFENVGFQATAYDGGSSGTGRKKGGTFKFDYFRMNIPSLTVAGESEEPVQLKGGNLVVK